MAYMNDPPLAGPTVAVPEARNLFAVGPAAEAHAALAHTLRPLTAALEDALRG